MQGLDPAAECGRESSVRRWVALEALPSVPRSPSESEHRMPSAWRKPGTHPARCATGPISSFVLTLATLGCGAHAGRTRPPKQRSQPDFLPAVPKTLVCELP
jgi:hypothetical protein